MSRKLFLTLCLISMFFFTGCATPIPFSGITTADARLEADTKRMLAQRAMFVQKCDRVDSIVATVIAIHPVGTGDTEASRMYGSVDERWTVRLCGAERSYAVTFTSDGKGGTYFRTSPLDPIN